MKKVLRYIFILLSCSSSGQLNTFQRIYYINANDNNTSYSAFIQIPDSGFFIGNLYRYLKTESNGDLEWMNRFQSPSAVKLYCIAPHINGGYLAAGHPFLIKFDSLLAVEWIKSFDIDGGYHSIKVAMDGFLLGGISSSSGIVTKVDTSGAIIWSKNFYASTEIYDTGSLDKTVDKGFIFCGALKTNSTSGSGYDSFVVKGDSLGNIVWAKRFVSSLGNTAAYHVSSCLDSTYIITGIWYGERFLLRLDSIGNIIWFNSYIHGIDGSAKC